jgi:trichothecene 3-O-acetyltransferase
MSEAVTGNGAPRHEAAAWSPVTLTPLDQTIPRIYGTRWILCFRLTAQADTKAIFEELKRALHIVLSDLPWLNGDVVSKAGVPEGSGQIEIVSRDQDATLRYSDLQDSKDFPYSFEDLRAARFPASKLPEELSPLAARPPPGKAAPVFAAQANFIKNGLLLTICAHHSGLDATGLATVLRTWARNTTSTQPVHLPPALSDRRPMMHGKPGGTTTDFPQNKIVSPDQQQYGASNIRPTQLRPTPANLFTISTASLQALKTASNAYSRNDALHALVWRSIARARAAAAANPDKQQTEQSSLLYAVNLRSRLTPPLDADWIGNGSWSGKTPPLSTADLIGPDGLKLAAKAIRDSVSGWAQPGYADRLIGFLGAQRPLDVQFDINPYESDMFSTSWENVDVLEAEWGGGLGRAECFRALGMGGNGALVVMPRLRNGEGLEFLVALEEGAMGCLLEDKDGEWGRWVESVKRG